MLRQIAVVAAYLCSGDPCLGEGFEPLKVPQEGKIGFTRMDGAKTGLRFVNRLEDERGVTNRNLLIGSGVAAGDVDGDGKVDLFFCGLDNGNVLYRNLGDWKFEDVTRGSGEIGMAGVDSTGATFADVDGDGDLDLLVNTLGGGTRLFLNDGSGRFVRKSDAGLQTQSGSTSMALADIDGDGDLDLYVANFRAETILDNPETQFTVGYEKNRPVVQKVNGRPATAGDLTNRFVVSASGAVEELGELDVLYENDGTGKFTVVKFDGGRFRDGEGNELKEAPRDWSLAVQMRDFTGDGAPDIYVCSDYWTPDRIWINDGRGNFQAAPKQAIRTTSYSSMGVDFADINRDGYFDFVVVDMLARTHRDRHAQLAEVPGFGAVPGGMDFRLQVPRNTVQLNRGDGTFSQIGEYCGLEASEWSWNVVFLDVDLDGWEDLLISNGHRRDFQNADATMAVQQALAMKRLDFNKRRDVLELFPPQLSVTAAFRNSGELRFLDVSREWGFTEADISHGSCLADLDGDGDLDLVMNNLGTECGVYRNDATAGRVVVKLVGGRKNSHGVGARMVLRSKSGMQQQEMIAGGRYLSCDDAERVFALGEKESATLEVFWRDGTRQQVKEVRGNRRYTVLQEGR
jgi:hypothetical protein